MWSSELFAVFFQTKRPIGLASANASVDNSSFDSAYDSMEDS